MTLAVLSQREDLSPDEKAQVKEDFVGELIHACRYEEAGDFLDHQSDFAQVFECYLKGNCFEKAIMVCGTN
jgi:hypothetical protein